MDNLMNNGIVCSDSYEYQLEVMMETLNRKFSDTRLYDIGKLLVR